MQRNLLEQRFTGWGFAGLFLIIKNKSIFSLFAPLRVAQRSSAHAAEAVSPASAAPPDLAHLHLLAHLAGVPTEASLSYSGPRALEARPHTSEGRRGPIRGERYGLETSAG